MTGLACMSVASLLALRLSAYSRLAKEYLLWWMMMMMIDLLRGRRLYTWVHGACGHGYHNSIGSKGDLDETDLILSMGPAMNIRSLPMHHSVVSMVSL